jgi:hypothetical protein
VVATWWSWLISDGSIEGGGFLEKKKKLVGGLETKNDAFLGVFMAK